MQAFVLAIAIGTGISLLMGVLVVRASGMGFLMLTLALSQALFQLSVQTSARPLTGAHDGLLIKMAPDATFLGLAQRDLMNPGMFWVFAWVCLVACAVLLWLVGRSRFGTLLEGIRENEERMRFSGYNTFLPPLGAFVLSGAVASLGGALFALNAGYVSSDLLGFTMAGDSLIAALVGAFGTLVGPVLGTTLFVYAQAHFNFGNLHLLTGIALIAVLMFTPGRNNRRTPAGLASGPSRTGAAEGRGVMSVFEARGLSVRYGALAALSDVDIALEPGVVHGVIGPNGAGKTTFIDALSGRKRPSAGAVCLDGNDITRHSVRWRRHNGVSRSFQRTSVFGGMSVRRQLGMVARKNDEPDLGEITDTLGLDEVIDDVCAEIAYGTQRSVDLAIALIGQPRVVLLDEPGAGLVADESVRMLQHVRDLCKKRGVAALLVEHDVEGVFRTCDVITVLDIGKVLASGAPAEVRADQNVIRAYLGSAA